MGILENLFSRESDPETANELQESLSLRSSLGEFMEELIENIKAWLTGDFSEAEGAGEGLPDAASTAIATEIVNGLTFEEIPNSVHNLKERQLGMFTSGMFGWEGSGDGEFNLDQESVNSEIRDLIDNRNIRSIVTVCGGDADTGIRNKLDELGYQNVDTLSFRIHTVDTLDQARAAYDNDLIHDLGTCYNMLQAGNACIHCQNGAHRSLTVSLIMFMLAHPEMTYEQSLAANMSASEAANSHFNAYSKLAQALENNPELRQQILAV